MRNQTKMNKDGMIMRQWWYGMKHFEQRWCDNQTNINKDGVIIKQRWFDNQTNMNKDGMKYFWTKIMIW